jgi:hypothetical protein
MFLGLPSIRYSGPKSSYRDCAEANQAGQLEVNWEANLEIAIPIVTVAKQEVDAPQYAHELMPIKGLGYRDRGVKGNAQPIQRYLSRHSLSETLPR